MTIRASILVVEYRTAEYLEGCLRALLASELPRDAFEIIVVDNASPTPVDHVRERVPQARWIHLRRNLGFAGGSALGLSRARGEIICGVNPDCRVSPSWLAEVLAAFDRDERVGVVGSKILHPGTTVLQHAGGRLFPNGRSEHLGANEPDRGQHDTERDCDYVCGAAFAVRRATVDEVGYLSPAYYPAYYEETELCTRARRAGWRVVYAPRARVEHEGSVASGGARSDAYLARYHEGRLRYVLRNHGPRELLLSFAPAELAWLRVMGRRERWICARAYAGAAVSALSSGRGIAGPGDVLAEHPPRDPEPHELGASREPPEPLAADRRSSRPPAPVERVSRAQGG